VALGAGGFARPVGRDVVTPSAPKKPRTRGFTLIEVLVAIAIIGLAATATARGIRATTNLLGENTLYDEAITHGQEVMEDLRAVRYEDMASGSRVSDDGIYTISWNVVPNNPGHGMKFVTVTTAWKWKGETRSYVLHTVYSKITPN